MADYIPADDNSLSVWATNFYNTVSADLALYGLTVADMSNLEDAFNLFGGALNDHQLAQANAKAKTQTKNSVRNDLVTEARKLAKRIQAHPALTDAKRAIYGITIPDTIPTAVAAPTSRPMVAVDTSNRLLHKVKFTDENTPLSNAKPAGVLGCEIYIKIGGDAPLNLDECKFLGVATKTPYEVSFVAEDGGKTAHYLCRWATRSGLTGATSQLTSSTIVA